MKTEIKRREFVGKFLKAGAAGVALVYGNQLLAAETQQQIQKPDLKGLTYCGFKCSEQCTLYRATIEDNPELRKKAYEEFKFKEKFNVDYDQAKVFCWGCKPKDKPLSINVTACTVRKCTIGKGYECCIECDGLKSCDKELWKNFPEFKLKVLEAQKLYNNS
jgi:hypothetical protein